jgi:hypothetical protein
MNELLGELEDKVTTKLKINTRNHEVWPGQANVLSRRLKYVISNLFFLLKIDIFHRL